MSVFDSHRWLSGMAPGSAYGEDLVPPRVVAKPFELPADQRNGGFDTNIPGRKLPELTPQQARTIVVELPQQVLPYWSINQVRAALDQHEIGQLQNSALLCDAMDRDDRIGSVLNVRSARILGLPKRFEPANDSAQAQRVCDIVREQWDTWCPPADLTRLLRWGLLEGVGCGELGYEYREKLLVPQMKVWHPQWLWWRWDLNGWFGGWQLNTMEGPVEPLPGNGKWVLIQPGGVRQPWMSGLVRSLSRPYLVRNFAYRDWARFSEVQGTGIKKAKVPSQADQEDKDNFFGSLQTLGQQSLVVLPQSRTEDKASFDLEMMKIDVSTGEGFQKLINECDSSIAIVVLGNNLTTHMPRGGSYAAASVHENKEMVYVRSDAALLSGTCQSQVLLPWTVLNFGDASLTPRMFIDVDPAVRADTKARTAMSGMQAVALARAAGVAIDSRRFLEALGVPMLPPGESSEKAPEQVGKSSSDLTPNTPTGGRPKDPPERDAARRDAAITSEIETLQERLDALETERDEREEQP